LKAGRRGSTAGHVPWYNAAVEPRIRYTRTRDGVSIAFWTLGEGPVLVNAVLPSSHIQHEWQTPALRAIYEWSAQTCRFVRFDHRGVGLSERDIEDFSLDRLVSVLEALVDVLAVEQVRMIAFAIGASTGLTERLGDGAFRKRARTLDTSLRRVIVAHGGEPVDGKLLGDGVLAVFGAARDAL
jgi:pimeloyl-ACP methyl ester carboxylesterase